MGQWTLALSLFLATTVYSRTSCAFAFAFSYPSSSNAAFTRGCGGGNHLLQQEQQRLLTKTRIQMIGGGFLDSLSGPPTPPPPDNNDDKEKKTKIQAGTGVSKGGSFLDALSPQEKGPSTTTTTSYEPPTTPEPVNNTLPPQQQQQQEKTFAVTNGAPEQAITNMNDTIDKVQENVLDIANSDKNQEFYLEESISKQVASISSSTLGPASRRTYRSYGNALREARTKNQKRLSRMAYEKQKAAEKIAKIKQRLQEQVTELETDLVAKLEDSQAKIDEEMSKIFDLLRSEIELEEARRQKIQDLITTIEAGINIKKTDLINEEDIAAEMEIVRYKLKEGTISKQLDELIDKKRNVAIAERAIVESMEEWTAEARLVIEESSVRSARVQEVFDATVRPEVAFAGDVQYEWDDLKEMESILEEAANNAQLTDAKFFTLKENFDEAVLSKTVLLGWSIPDSLKGVASKAAAKEKVDEITEEVKAAMKSSVRADDLSAKQEEEIVGILARAVGNAALGSAKVGVFGLKAVLDAVTDKNVANATGKVNVKKGDSSSIVKSTEAIGKAGGVIAQNMGKTKSASQAQEALKQTSQDLASAFNAVAALGMKSAQKMQEEAEKSKKEVDEYNKNKGNGQQ